MKKLALIITTLLLSVSVFAQQDVTKFLGIPIDGFKPEMIKKLKAKGFVEHPYSPNVLLGEFNGNDVIVNIVTNNNKVYRIFLEDRYGVSEADIKIRFNTLCRQFDNNERYVSAKEKGGFIIPKPDDISYQMSVNSKRYEAAFYQTPANPKDLNERINAKYTSEQLAQPTEEIRLDLMKMAEEYGAELGNMMNKIVWFMIIEDNGKYKILMFYDNKLNQANGEDL